MRRSGGVTGPIVVPHRESLGGSFARAWFRTAARRAGIAALVIAPLLVGGCTGERPAMPLSPDAAPTGTISRTDGAPPPRLSPTERPTPTPRPPIAFAHGQRRWTVSAEELGLAAASSEPDEARLNAYLQSLARDVERSAIDAELVIGSDLAAEIKPPAPGLALDVDSTAERLRAALRSRSDGPTIVELATRELAPAVAEADLAGAQADVRGALSGPLTLRLGKQSWTLSPQEIAPALSVSSGPAGAKPSVWVDEGVLGEAVRRFAPRVEQPAQDARFAWNGGNLAVLRESREGRRLDVERTVARARAGLFGPNRAIDLAVAPVQPAIDSRQPERLGIRGPIESARTSFAGGIPEKQQNIKLAASRLNGVVVPPGATFSFNREVGPTTLASGFQWGYGIVGGGDEMKTVPSVAGGICQVSTTLFQAVFWSGYQIETRSWHLYWIPSYISKGVVGLDSTVDAESGLDFKFTNTTKDHLLIQSGVEGSEVWFSLYGTKPAWRVEIDKPVITNRKSPDARLVEQEDPTLTFGRRLQVEAARDGFDVVIVRRVYDDASGGAAAPRTLDLRSSYQPSRNVVLVGTKGRPAGVPAATATPTAGSAQPNRTPPAGPQSATPAAPARTATPRPAATPKPATPSPKVTPTVRP